MPASIISTYGEFYLLLLNTNCTNLTNLFLEYLCKHKNEYNEFIEVTCKKLFKFNSMSFLKHLNGIFPLKNQLLPCGRDLLFQLQWNPIAP